MTDDRPFLLIVDGAVDVTGALVAAARQAEMMADEWSTVLVLSEDHRVPVGQFTLSTKSSHCQSFCSADRRQA